MAVVENGLVCVGTTQVCLGELSMLRNWLAHPLTRDLDLDDPTLTVLRRRIIAEKQSLRRIYGEWYEQIASALPAVGGHVVELGAGGGFLDEYIPGLVKTEVLLCPELAVVADGQRLPFCNGSLRGIVMTDVLHHIPRPRLFFAEARRCLKDGGRVIMIEPWVTRWSRWIYGKLHHEPFRPDSADWEFPTSGPLSGANGALPWIIFQRDRKRFEREFAEWNILTVKPFMPFQYLVSGGVSMRNLAPDWCFRGVVWLEERMERRMDNWAMFALVVIEKKR